MSSPANTPLPANPRGKPPTSSLISTRASSASEMFHTFQMPGASSASPKSDGSRSGRHGSTKRVTISNACVECRRRKIRCDGAQPCSQCQYYRETCVYAKPAPRVPLSKKLVDKLEAERDRYHSLFSRLFAGQELDNLLALSRAELVEIVLRPTTASTPSSDGHNGIRIRPELGQTSDSAESLEALDQAPEQNLDHDEVARYKSRVDGIADDINGLSFSADRQSSYVGVSSITAALKVIVKTAPIAKDFLGSDRDEDAPNSAIPKDEPDPYWLPAPEEGQRLIQSYFSHIHPFMPMINEDDFCDTYRCSKRRDTPWMALLNMVFALGSLSSSHCFDQGHITYYQRARHHLDLEAFGSGSIDILRALGLIGGYYLHWLNRPNEANGIMGATLRMALALGLHREYSHVNRTPGANRSRDEQDSEIPDDIRRRTWWSLFCLDSWASLPTGRPTLGRGGMGIMVESPRIPEQTKSHHPDHDPALKLLPIVHNTSLSKIATRVQDFLAASPLIKFDLLLSLDAELEKWHDELPSILMYPDDDDHRTSNTVDINHPSSEHDECPSILQTPRAVMHWRYHNTRILLHRPFLLAATLRRTPFANLSTEEQVSVSRCRAVAGETLAHIERNLRDDLITGWNAVWLAYQAVMVPLVSLFSVLASPTGSDTGTTTTGSPDAIDHMSNSYESGDDMADWRRQIEAAIRIFDRMQPYSVAAKKSKDVVERLYNASRYFEQQQQHQRHGYTPELPPVISPNLEHASSEYYMDPIPDRPHQHHSHPLHPQPHQMQHHAHGQLFHPASTVPPPINTTMAMHHMQAYPSYDPNAWHFPLPNPHHHPSQPHLMDLSLEVLEWDASVPPGDMNHLMDAFEYTAPAAAPNSHNSNAGNVAATGAIDWGAVNWHGNAYSHA